jgi:hypothetical protein
MSYAATCMLCARPIGAYEPVVLIEGGRAVRASRATHPGLGHGKSSLYHLECYEASTQPAGEPIEPTGPVG